MLINEDTLGFPLTQDEMGAYLWILLRDIPLTSKAAYIAISKGQAEKWTHTKIKDYCKLTEEQFKEDIKVLSNKHLIYTRHYIKNGKYEPTYKTLTHPWMHQLPIKKEEKDLQINSNGKNLCHTSIDELELTSRATNALKLGDINTIGQLIELTRNDLLKMPNMGLKSFKEIFDRLSERGLSLGMDINKIPESKPENLKSESFYNAKNDILEVLKNRNIDLGESIEILTDLLGTVAFKEIFMMKKSLNLSPYQSTQLFAPYKCIIIEKIQNHIDEILNKTIND